MRSQGLSGDIVVVREQKGLQEALQEVLQEVSQEVLQEVSAIFAASDRGCTGLWEGVWLWIRSDT